MIFRSSRWTYDELGALIGRAALVPGAGERIAFISGHFLGIPYREATLIGGARVPENLVADLSGVDCFTFLDYVEAMRMSLSLDDFPLALQKVRYHGGVVTYRTRNHFFSGWAMYNSGFVTDVTGEVAHGRAVSLRKELNRSGDGTLLLEGIEPRTVALTVIPSGAVDQEMASNLRTGDYAGIYSEREGLDVSHVGIIIRTKDALLLRHASSAPEARAVVDQDFLHYITGRPGLIVVRPLDSPVRISACEQP